MRKKLTKTSIDKPGCHLKPKKLLQEGRGQLANDLRRRIVKGDTCMMLMYQPGSPHVSNMAIDKYC